MRFCVFLGSSNGANPAFRAAASALGAALAARGIGVVYGGNVLGLMGAVAETAFAAGDEVIGVIPHSIAEMESARTELSKLHVVDNMHERKALMAQLSAAFVVLPGGIGTFEELFEVWSWAKLGLQMKPIGLLNTAGFYDKLLDFIEHVEAEGFTVPADRELIVVSHEIDDLIDALLERLARMPDEAQTGPGLAAT
jgi:uncharacterized protein (TIGR00730 family)